MKAGKGIPQIEASSLEPVVAKILDRPVTSLSDWVVEPIHGGMGETLGIYRVSGEVVDGGESIPWSVVLKAIGKPAKLGERPDWNYWLREARLYQSGLMAELPATLALPRCFGVTERPDDRIWLWLEHINEDPDPWSLADFGRVGFGLGQLNAPYLSGQPIPADPWLSRGWLRSKLADAAPAITLLPTARQHPMVRRALPTDVAEWILQVWANRDRYLGLLDQLPRSLCHQDVFRRNVLADRKRATYALIDWAFVGDGAIGEELVPLVQASVIFFEVELSSADDLEQTVLAEYVAGLRASGFRGDPRLVELGYAAAASIRYSLGALDQILMMLSDERFYPGLELAFRRPIGEACDAWAAIFREHVRPQEAAALALATELGL